MNNRELFKEAIADAKAVKEAAIANAKVALEEAFAPFLREKLTQKLSEMEEETYESEDEISEDEYGDSTDKDFLQNEMSYDEKAMEAPVGEMNMMGDETIDELNLDELLAELELEEEMSDETDLNEAKEEEEEEEEETEEEEYTDVDADGIEDSDDTEIDITDMESLKSIIEDEIEKMIQSGELQAGPEYEAEEGEEMEMGNEMVADWKVQQKEKIEAAIQAQQDIIDGEKAAQEQIDKIGRVDQLAAQAAQGMIGSGQTALGQFNFAQSGSGNQAITLAQKQVASLEKIEAATAEQVRLQKDMGGFR